MIRFIVPGKAVPKGRPRFNRKTGIVHTDGKTVRAESVIRKYCTGVMLRHRLKPLTGPVEAHIVVILKPAKSWTKGKREAALSNTIWPVSRPDKDNYEKLILDACNGIAYEDDSQIVRSFCEKRFGPEDLTVICFKPVAGDANPENYQEILECLKHQRPGTMASIQTSLTIT